MTVVRLEARNVRVITAAQLELGAGLNVLIGPNASGKTSVLEALSLLGLGRSFVTSQLEKVVRHGCDHLEVVARLDDDGRAGVLGLRRSLTRPPEVHIDGAPAGSLAALAERLPLQAIHPRSDELILGGPSARRRFMDWGVFHVEQEFLGLWRRYRRALEQRNAVLRAGADVRDVVVWETAMAGPGERLAALREGYLASLEAYLHRTVAALLDEEPVELRYHRGWSQGQSLVEALAGARERDRRSAQTSAGPHRAELELLLANRSARSGSSRGQQKMLIYALHIAQVLHLEEERGRQVLLLIDDLSSELDGRWRERALALIGGLRGQVLVTALDAGQLGPLPATRPHRVFHVERGELRELV